MQKHVALSCFLKQLVFDNVEKSMFAVQKCGLSQTKVTSSEPEDSHLHDPAAPARLIAVSHGRIAPLHCQQFCVVDLCLSCGRMSPVAVDKKVKTITTKRFEHLTSFATSVR